MTSEQTRQDQEPIAAFSDVLQEVNPVRLTEHLAETLGAFDGTSAVVEYSYLDVVKMAGHACPTTAAAYECCRAALKSLYPDQIPVRGEIEVTIYGEPDDGVYGVIGQVFSLITGAAPATGFKGLATFFRRKDLLKYEANGPDPSAMCFRFTRTDNARSVLCWIYPDKMPSLDPDDSRRLRGLMKKVLWEAAKSEEISEFRTLWRQSVKAVFESAKQSNQWLTIEEVKIT